MVGAIAVACGNYLPDDSSLRSVVLARARFGVLLPSDHRLATKPRLSVKDLVDESLLMSPRRQHPRLHGDIIAAASHGVVLNLQPEIFDREAVWTLVASGPGATFAGETGARFLDVAGTGGGAGPLHLGSSSLDLSQEFTGRRALVTGFAGVPLGRPGRAAEVAEMIAFLVSPRGEWITGHDHYVDGGQGEL